jgi:hypothetical protein
VSLEAITGIATSDDDAEAAQEQSRAGYRRTPENRQQQQRRQERRREPGDDDGDSWEALDRQDEARQEVNRQFATKAQSALVLPDFRGKGFYGWIRDQDQRTPGFHQWWDDFGGANNYPRMFKDWTEVQIALGWSEFRAELNERRDRDREQPEPRENGR